MALSKLCSPLVLLAALACTQAWCADPGTCDPKGICILSAEMNAQETVHFVSQITIGGVSMSLPDKPELAIENDSGVVSLIDGAKSIAVGEIEEPVGENAHTELIRNLDPAAGIDLSISSKSGKDVSSCNPTGAGVIYEHTKYHTTDLTLRIARNEQVIEEITVNQWDRSPFSTIPSPIPCERLSRPRTQGSI